jgi:hypothetical protein
MKVERVGREYIARRQILLVPPGTPPVETVEGRAARVAELRRKVHSHELKPSSAKVAAAILLAAEIDAALRGLAG